MKKLLFFIILFSQVILIAQNKNVVFNLSGISYTIENLEQLIEDGPISFYPLHVGDKWYYEVKYLPVWSTNELNYNLTKSIIKDTILENEKKYYVIKETRLDSNLINFYYERIDSITNKVFRYNPILPDSEYVLFNLSTSRNSFFTTVLEYFDQYSTQLMYLIEVGFESIFDEQISNVGYRIYSANNINNTYGVSYKLLENLGVTYYSNSYLDSFDEYHYLKAAFINNEIYGDTTLVGIKKEKLELLPAQFSLSQNYPNPFNPTTTIKYQIPTPLNPPFAKGGNIGGFVTLKIHDILGREVSVLVNKQQNPSNYEVTFNAGLLASGVYYYQLKFGNIVKTKKMIVLR